MSSVLKKILNALTGIGLISFLIFHLAGNLTLFSNGPALFNSYAKYLHDLGWLLTALEISLVVLFAAHIISSLAVTIANRRARDKKYVANSKGRASATSPRASRNMIYTGIILLVFTIWHVKTFRFGPGIAEGYETVINGEISRDLHALVYDFFRSHINVAIYTAVMVFLGFHLRHGYWSAFQSVGAVNKKYMPFVKAAGYFTAVILSVGFLVIPLWVHITGHSG